MKLGVRVAGLVAVVLGLVPAAASAFTWSPAVTISGNDLVGGANGAPKVAMDANGDAIAAWVTGTDQSTGLCPCVVRAAYRPAGGSFGAPVDISPTIANPADAWPVHVAMGGNGDAVIAWSQPSVPSDDTAEDNDAYAVARSAGADGSFGGPILLDTSGSTGYEPRPTSIAMDAAGDAVIGLDAEQSTGGGGSTAEAEVAQLAAGSSTVTLRILSDSAHAGQILGVAMSPDGNSAAEIETSDTRPRRPRLRSRSR